MGSFVFPFALAQSAAAEMDELATRVRFVINAHDSAIAIAHVDFEGATRDQFDSEFAAQLDEMRSLAQLLDGDADALRQTIVRARWLRQLEEQDHP